MSEEPKRPNMEALRAFTIGVVEYIEWLEAEIERKDKVFNDLVKSREG